MNDFAPDRFDDPPTPGRRIGSHRAPARKGTGWITFAWAALATGVLVAGGVVFFSIATNTDDGDLDAVASATPTPTVSPITDPADIKKKRGITITVLNGTPNTGLEDTVDEELSAAGWPVTAATKADQNTVETTVVYYVDTADEDVALGLALALGVDDVLLSDSLLGASVTVVLGADYAAAE